MKDSQRLTSQQLQTYKYIKANNERFSTRQTVYEHGRLSISRRIMKDSQHSSELPSLSSKYIKANNERFSTMVDGLDVAS